MYDRPLVLVPTFHSVRFEPFILAMTLGWNSLKLKVMMLERPALYEWKSVGDATVEFQFRTSSTGTDQGFKMRLRCDRK